MTVADDLPKISIVTPSLNQGQFLRQCMDSVRAQNWSNLEHFIIDGGSTDETLAILKERENQITRWISEPDKGAADAINKGFAMCTGDIVAWLNADDYYLPKAFDAIAAAWRKSPDAPFWFGNGQRVDEAGRFKSSFNNRPMLYSRKALIEGTDYILQPSTFMNGRVLKQVGGLDTSLRWSFDWDLWTRMTKHGTPVALEVVLSATREWGETLTSTGSLRRIEEIRLMVERHSGKPITFGSLCYLFDTMLKEMHDRPQDFSGETKKAVAAAWRSIEREMQGHLPVDARGMPVYWTREQAAAASKPESQFMKLARRGRSFVRRTLSD
jgi:hypothetical protein